MPNYITCEDQQLNAGALAIAIADDPQVSLRSTYRGLEIDRPLWVNNREVTGRAIQVIQLTPPAEPSMTIIDTQAVYMILAVLMAKRLWSWVWWTVRLGALVSHKVRENRRNDESPY